MWLLNLAEAKPSPSISSFIAMVPALRGGSIRKPICFKMSGGAGQLTGPGMSFDTCFSCRIEGITEFRLTIFHISPSRHND
jgi:hypothetical protein